MLRTIDLDQVRVVQADNHKGNSRVYLEILDARVLYTEPGCLPAHYITRDEFGQLVADTEALADLFRARLGAVLAGLLMADCGDMLREMGWSTTTDRGIGYTRPRLAEDPDN
jgi:hypothetical protein